MFLKNNDFEVKKQKTAIRSVIRRYNRSYNLTYNASIATKILYFARYNDIIIVSFLVYDKKKDNKLITTAKISDLLEENGLGYAKCMSYFFRKTSYCTGQTFYD